MNEEQMRDLVKECDLDWQRGYVALFEGDDTNRYAVLIAATVAAERERIADLLAGCATEAEGHGPVDVGASIRSGRLVDMA